MKAHPRVAAATVIVAAMGASTAVLATEIGNSSASDFTGTLALTIRRLEEVLWTTNELQVWNHPESRATARWRMLGAPLCVIEEVKEAT